MVVAMVNLASFCVDWPSRKKVEIDVEVFACAGQCVLHRVPPLLAIRRVPGEG
jgi:hypothetical protein